MTGVPATMTEKTYEQGLLEGEVRSLEKEIVIMAKAITALTVDVDTLKKAMFMLYGAIAILGFVVPLMWRWALN